MKIYTHLKLVVVSCFIYIFAMSPVYATEANTKKPLSVYFAGSLFSQKDLIGNLYLSEAISKISEHRYKCFMVQNKVQQKVTHKIIKDQDLLALIDSDVALFAFDGTELDSGTVVEFIAAKFLDKPAVIYRTDFRGGSGEEAIDEHSNKWNLMVSFYPRTKIVYLNAMVEYQKIYEQYKNESAHVISQKYSEYIAQHLIDNMDDVLSESPILKGKDLLSIQQNYKKLMGIIE